MKTGRNMLRVCVMMGLLLGALHSFANEQDIVLIGHPDITDSLTPDEVQQIFLGRKTRWSDDSSITFLLYNHDPILEQFLKTYIKKTPFQYKNFWKKQVFTGKGRMPKAFKQLEGVLEFVAATEGAMSFVPRETAVEYDDVTIIPIQE